MNRVFFCILYTPCIQTISFVAYDAICVIVTTEIAIVISQHVCSPHKPTDAIPQEEHFKLEEK